MTKFLSKESCKDCSQFNCFANVNFMLEVVRDQDVFLGKSFFLSVQGASVSRKP